MCLIYPATRSSASFYRGCSEFGIQLLIFDLSSLWFLLFGFLVFDVPIGPTLDSVKMKIKMKILWLPPLRTIFRRLLTTSHIFCCGNICERSFPWRGQQSSSPHFNHASKEKTTSRLYNFVPKLS